MESQNINSLPVGHRLDSGKQAYTIRAVIGKGGFGITYKGELSTMLGHIKVTVPVAIKEFFPASLCERIDGAYTMSYSNPTRDQVEKARRDFVGEARRLNGIAGRHPNIVAVNEVFEANNTAYYVMEFLDGLSLADYVKQHGAMSEEAMLSIMRPVISAVAFLHSEHITHLDIKPANIVIARTEEGALRPVLIDFGLSKHYDDDGNPTSTLNSNGYSEGYAPREQYGGISSFSPATDVYALGATMMYCLTGKRLPSSLTLTEAAVAALIPAPVSQPTRNALMAALALHADDRLPNAGRLLEMLPGTENADDATQIHSFNRNVESDSDTIQIDMESDTPSAPVQREIKQPELPPMPKRRVAHQDPEVKKKSRKGCAWALWLTLGVFAIAIFFIADPFGWRKSDAEKYIEAAREAIESMEGAKTCEDLVMVINNFEANTKDLRLTKQDTLDLMKNGTVSTFRDMRDVKALQLGCY